MKLKRKELLALPWRDWKDTEKEYREILLTPSGKKHDSGFMTIALIGVWVEDGEAKYEIAAMPDSISYFFPVKKLDSDFSIATVRQDCFYPQGVMRYFGNGVFKISAALSDVDITFIPANPKLT